MQSVTPFDRVLSGEEKYHLESGDNLKILPLLPTGSVNLTFTSPPYEAARTYGVSYSLKGQAWVDWMVERVVEMCRVTDGLVCINMAGQLRDHCYSPVVEWLAADLTRNHGIVCGPAPYVYFRFGIPGSGGKHYHRRDWEPVYCFCRPEVLPLKWSDNTATGHPPKWAPGGEMSNRLTSGARVNQWGGGKNGGGSRRPGGKRQGKVRPSHVEANEGIEHCTPGVFGDVEEVPGSPGTKKMYARNRNGERDQGEHYRPPTIANSGNVIREKYDAEQVRKILEDLVTQRIEPGDVIRCLVGGGAMGSELAHKNEAPFPEDLVEFFVRSYAPPDGIVLDPFSGSGTTVSVARRCGRRGIGIDLRPEQVEVARLRVSGQTPDMFA